MDYALVSPFVYLVHMVPWQWVLGYRANGSWSSEIAGDLRAARRGAVGELDGSGSAKQRPGWVQAHVSLRLDRGC